MPQLDIYRACDEIIIVLMGFMGIYMVILAIVFPLMFFRLVILKFINERNINKIEKNKNYQMMINFVLRDEYYIMKI